MCVQTLQSEVAKIDMVQAKYPLNKTKDVKLDNVTMVSLRPLSDLAIVFLLLCFLSCDFSAPGHVDDRHIHFPESLVGSANKVMLSSSRLKVSSLTIMTCLSRPQKSAQ